MSQKAKRERDTSEKHVHLSGKTFRCFGKNMYVFFPPDAYEILKEGNRGFGPVFSYANLFAGAIGKMREDKSRWVGISL